MLYGNARYDGDGAGQQTICVAGRDALQAPNQHIVVPKWNHNPGWTCPG